MFPLFFFVAPPPGHPHSASPLWHSPSSIFSFRSQNILDLLRTKSSWKPWPTPPHRCHASIRTLNGPLKGPVQVGVRSKYQVHHSRDEPGIVGAAIYREIFIDQRSKRSHPNKAVDVVVCQSFWIDFWFSLHQLRFCPPKPIAWNRCGVFSPPRLATQPPLSAPT